MSESIAIETVTKSTIDHAWHFGACTLLGSHTSAVGIYLLRVYKTVTVWVNRETKGR
jgi:hypothetical protein